MHKATRRDGELDQWCHHLQSLLQDVDTSEVREMRAENVLLKNQLLAILNEN